MGGFTPAATENIPRNGQEKKVKNGYEGWERMCSKFLRPWRAWKDDLAHVWPHQTRRQLIIYTHPRSLTSASAWHCSHLESGKKMHYFAWGEHVDIITPLPSHAGVSGWKQIAQKVQIPCHKHIRESENVGGASSSSTRLKVTDGKIRGELGQGVCPYWANSHATVHLKGRIPGKLKFPVMFSHSNNA